MAILFKKGVEIGPITLIKDKEGKILSLFFIFEKQIFQVINLCAPTNPSLRNKFYKNHLKQTNNSSNQNLIWAGDLNMVEDLFLDRQGGAPCNSHIIGLTDLTKNKTKTNLQDTWHKKKHNKRIFTYHNFNNSIQSRIDQMYVL